jgi:putative endonuclease
MSSKNVNTAEPAALPPSKRRHKGAELELLAADYLTRQGLQLVQCNYHCRLGEIDLIMRDKGVLVFIEVRFRTRSDFVCPLTSINHRKQQKLLRTAAVYLKQHQLTDKVPCRLDVVGITNDQGELHFRWISDAIRPGF